MIRPPADDSARSVPTNGIGSSPFTLCRLRAGHFHCGQQAPGCRSRVVGAANGGADRDTGRAGTENIGQVGLIDPADGERRNRSSLNRVQQGETCESLKPLGLRGKHRSDSNVIGAVTDGVASLLGAVRGNPHEARGPENLSHVGNAQLVLSDVDAIGIGQQGQIGPIVHDEQRARFGGPTTQRAGALEQEPVTDGFLAKLDDLRAASQRAAHRGLETVAAGRSAGQDVKARSLELLCDADAALLVQRWLVAQM